MAGTGDVPPVLGPTPSPLPPLVSSPGSFPTSILWPLVPHPHCFTPAFLSVCIGAALSSCAGMKCPVHFISGHFSMDMKLPKGNSGGTILSFYLMDTVTKSNTELAHSEIDIEFYGNTSSKFIQMSTNVYADGHQNLAQVRIRTGAVCACMSTVCACRSTVCACRSTGYECAYMVTLGLPASVARIGTLGVSIRALSVLAHREFQYGHSCPTSGAVSVASRRMRRRTLGLFPSSLPLELLVQLLLPFSLPRAPAVLPALGPCRCFPQVRHRVQHAAHCVVHRQLADPGRQQNPREALASLRHAA